MPRWLKVVVACVLLAALAAGIDWPLLPQHLAMLDWRMASIGVAAIGLELVVNASKWSWSLRLHDLRFPWMYLFRSGCFAFFFNNFLPTAIGGDVYRVYRTWTPNAERSRAVSAVLVERAVGFAAMLFNGAIGALFVAGTSSIARAYLGLAAAGAAAALVAMLLVRSGWLDSLRASLARVAWLEPMRANLRRIARPRREWLRLVASSFLFQFLATAVVYVAFASIGSQISIPAAALITAAAGVATVLPISISGIGVVEGSIAAAAVALGSSYESAVLAAVIVRLFALTVSAGCGLLYLTEREQPRPTERLFDDRDARQLGRSQSPQADSEAV